MPSTQSKDRVPGEETWTGITGDNPAATERRRRVYDRCFSICTCGHGPESHDFRTERHSRTEGDGPVQGIVECDSLFPGYCNIGSCGCTGYDHIAGKPDHPLNPLCDDDPRLPAIRSQIEGEARERLLAKAAIQRQIADKADRGSLAEARADGKRVAFEEAAVLLGACRCTQGMQGCPVHDPAAALPSAGGEEDEEASGHDFAIGPPFRDWLVEQIAHLEAISLTPEGESALCTFREVQQYLDCTQPIPASAGEEDEDGRPELDHFGELDVIQAAASDVPAFEEVEDHLGLADWSALIAELRNRGFELVATQPIPASGESGEEERPEIWERVDWADLRQGDEVRLYALDMQEGWQQETRTVLGRDGDTIRFHCGGSYAHTGKPFDYDYDPATDDQADRRRLERRSAQPHSPQQTDDAPASQTTEAESETKP